MVQLLHFLSHLLQPILVPLCCVTAWATVLGGLWTLGATVQQGFVTLRRLHQIPCANCVFFTDSYYLKCPVHPFTALTEDAIHCCDYTPHTKGSEFLT